MSKPLSRLQLRANRLNAKLSTGPKTPQGKDAVRANLEKANAARRAAKRHFFIQATARTEDETDTLQILHDEAIRQHKPANDEELHIVEEIIRNQMSIWRYVQAQSDLFTQLADEAALAGHPTPQSRAHQQAAVHPSYLGLDKLIARCNRLRSRLFADLRLCRKLQAESAANAPLPQPEPIAEDLIQEIIQHVEHTQNEKNGNPANTSFMRRSFAPLRKPETNPPDTLEPAA